MTSEGGLLRDPEARTRLKTKPAVMRLHNKNQNERGDAKARSSVLTKSSNKTIRLVFGSKL